MCNHFRTDEGSFRHSTFSRLRAKNGQARPSPSCCCIQHHSKNPMLFLFFFFASRGEKEAPPQCCFCGSKPHSSEEITKGDIKTQVAQNTRFCFSEYSFSTTSDPPYHHEKWTRLFACFVCLWKGNGTGKRIRPHPVKILRVDRTSRIKKKVVSTRQCNKHRRRFHARSPSARMHAH